MQQRPPRPVGHDRRPGGVDGRCEPTIQMDSFGWLGPVELNVWWYDNQDRA